MEKNATDINGVRIIPIRGRFTATNSLQLRNAVEEALPVPGKIVLNLVDMTYIDSTGVGVLGVLRDLSRSYGHEMKLVGLQMCPRCVFCILKVYSLFQVYDSLNAALESFQD